MFQIYSFCRQVDDIADSDGPRPERLAALQQWRDDIDALYQGHPPARLRDYVASVRRFGLKREDFLAIVDGMEMDVPQDIRAPDLATLDLYCDRVASAVGRLSVRVFGLAAGRRHPARASSRPRAAIDQYPARHRRGRRHRPAVPAARRSAARRHHLAPIRSRSSPIRRCRKYARRWSQRARTHFEKADEVMAPQSAPRGARAADHVEILSGDPGIAGRPRVCGAARAGSPQQARPHRHRSSLRT